MRFGRPDDAYVVKVQLPLFASPGGMNDVLVYNEDRTVSQVFRLSDRDVGELREIMGGEPRGYFHAHTGDTQMLELDSAAPEQDW